ncbi:hypothetical protein M011DRAFT_484742 [Sporormia fimetaria CBS 119925]|uniref:Uncharacterized protein n=1 Tax=Sporormia fimetaria CBS 119925 TaxID=1340428 RepID=A0A6A6VFA0_9PLEO|nr:hypothetical protein M011DRAFT_484742 [Sporormia fimetaria CBS 119925]
MATPDAPPTTHPISTTSNLATSSLSWTDTDASTFSPSALPVAKRPRPWDRKPVVVRKDGAEKKVWRRYATRSSTSGTVAPEDVEELDERARATKRLQRVKPTELEFMAPRPHARVKMWKGMRYDRRVSGVMRKRANVREGVVGKGGGEGVEGEMERKEEDCDDRVPGTNPEQETTQDVVSSPRRTRSSARFSFRPVGVDESVATSGPSETATAEQSIKTEEIQETEYMSEEVGLEEAILPGFANSTGSVPVLLPDRDDSADSVAEDVSHSATDETTPSSPIEENLSSPSTGVPNGAIAMSDCARSENESTVDANAHTPDPEHAPTSPNVSSNTVAMDHEAPEEDEDAGSDPLLDIDDDSMDDIVQSIEVEAGMELPEDDFTEASLQLEIQQDLEEEQPGGLDSSAQEQASAVSEAVQSQGTAQVNEEEVTAPLDSTESPTSVADGTDTLSVGVAKSNDLTRTTVPCDIADGLTLTPSLSVRTLTSSDTPTVTRTEPGTTCEEVTGILSLDDDTALLKDFLTRAAASKANKAATIARRSSLQNRRDSDVIRHALASPRKVLEDKDPNSPSKFDDMTLDLSQTLTISLEQEIPLSPSKPDTEIPPTDEGKPIKTSRRSSRARRTRLPAPPTSQTQTPKNISVRRADGGEHIVLKRSEAQELGLLTRANTRKNKQGAIAVPLRLLKLASDAGNGSLDKKNSGPKQVGKTVHWDETLAYYQEHTQTVAYALAEAESLATPDELSALGLSTPLVKNAGSKGVGKDKVKDEKKEKETGSTRGRRARGLGAANGTPGKRLLGRPASETDDDELATAIPSAIPAATSHKSKAKSRTKSASALTPAPEKTQKTQKTPKPVSAIGIPKPTSTVQTPVETPTLSIPQPTTTSTSTVTNGNMTSSKPPSLPHPPSRIAKERKSRLATPRKVKIPVPTPAAASMTSTGTPLVVGDGKEDSQSRIVGIAAGTPKKGIRLPEVGSSGVGVESASGGGGGSGSGLPRRRAGRRV